MFDKYCLFRYNKTYGNECVTCGAKSYIYIDLNICKFKIISNKFPNSWVQCNSVYGAMIGIFGIQI